METDVAVISLICGRIKLFCVMSTALFWCAYTARGILEYLPITRSWFAAELSRCLDKMADVNSVDLIKNALFMPRLAICSRDLHWHWINWTLLCDTMEVSMLRLAWLTTAQHVFQPALTGRLELVSRKIVSRGPRTKAIAVSKFREKLSPANWIQGVTAISRKILRSQAPKNGVQHATAIYSIPRYTRPRYIGLTLYKDKTVVRPSYLYNGNSYTGKQERLKGRNTLGCLDQYAAQNSKYARPPIPSQPPTQKVFFQWHTQYDPTMKHSHCETVYAKELFPMAVLWIGSLPPNSLNSPNLQTSWSH